MKALFISGVSACFELDQSGAYYAKEPYEIYKNGEPCGTKDTNVFSLFGLTPSTDYEVVAAGERITFRTEDEAACLDAKQNGAGCIVAIGSSAPIAKLFDAGADHYIRDFSEFDCAWLQF